jgi:hypothetical protein
MHCLKMLPGFPFNGRRFSPSPTLYSLNTIVAYSRFELIVETQLTTQMGLFPEIQRAYITVDNRLYLWNYLNGYLLHEFG